MKKRTVAQIAPWLGKEELAQIKESIEAQWISGGPKVKQFQEEMAKLCGVKHALAVCNGTQALYIGLLALGVGKGDEVIVPDFTFIASANAVTWTGAKPIFVDIDRNTFNLDPVEVKNAITKKTKAIMPVHLYGQSASMGEIMRIAKKHRLYVIEDAAQGVGVTYKGKPVGGFGEIGCLSFYADKILTTGEGGMVLTNDDELAKKCVILLNQGRTGRGWYIHDYIGYNFRMTDLQAGIGVAQVKKLPKLIQRRKRVEELYRTHLARVPGVQFPFRDPSGFRVPYRIFILVDDPQGLLEFLGQREIRATRTFYPLHLQPCYKGVKIAGDFPHTAYAYEKILQLPSAVTLEEQDIAYVSDAIKEFFKAC